MRHRLAINKLSRHTKQRHALIKNLIGSLILKGEIVTTIAKAKVIGQLTDKLVSKAKKSSLASRRAIAAFFNRPPVTKKLVDELAPKMTGRNSGYTRITRLGVRQGDNAQLAKIEFTDKVVTPAPDAKKKPDSGAKAKPEKKAPAAAKTSFLAPLTGKLKAQTAAAPTAAPRTTHK